MTWRAWATFAALCAIWGLPYFFIKLALQDLSPACIAWGRITLAAIVLVPIAWRRGCLQKAFAHKVAVTAFAVAELVIPFWLIAVGEQWISSSLTGILVATVPLTVVLIAPLFGVRERIGALRIAGLAIGFCGVIAIIGLDIGHGPMLWAGVICIMISVAGYAIGPLVVERYLSDVDELGAVAASLVVASILLLPFAVLSAPTQVPSALSLGAVAALGVACTALALYLYFYLINVAGAARASVVAYINPAVAAVIGVLVLDEPFGVATAVGMAMILFGSWLATGKSKSRLDAVAGLEHPPDDDQARRHEHERHAET
jgi:drug/metabolite transporter (DMT)-like permease